MNVSDMASYEIGHREGESSRQADWSLALTEYCELPEGVDHESPFAVALYIAGLQRAEGSGPPTTAAASARAVLETQISRILDEEPEHNRTDEHLRVLAKIMAAIEESRVLHRR